MLLKVIKPYTRIRIGFIATELNVPACADTYVPGPRYRTYGLHAPTSRVLYVPAAQGSCCPTVRTPYA